MVMVTVPSASPLLAVGAPRSFLQLIQLLLRPLSNSRSLSHQRFARSHPTCFRVRSRSGTPAASRCCSNPHHDFDRQTHTPMSWCVSIADFKFSATSFQGNFRAFSNSLIKNFSLGCRAVQRSRLLNPILCQNDTFVNHWSLASPDFVVPSLIQIACWHGSVLVHHSFSEWQLTRVSLSRNTQKCVSPVVFT